MTIINEKDQIKYEYETLTNALDELGVSSEKGLAELSLWGRVSELVNERDSRIAALEAQNKKLANVLANVIGLLYQFSRSAEPNILEWKHVKDANAMLAEVKK